MGGPMGGPMLPKGTGDGLNSAIYASSSCLKTKQNKEKYQNQLKFSNCTLVVLFTVVNSKPLECIG
jgi:hypothetical protein